jgi:NADPH:quinone reductase-like Zn-dependent oxidoreductase
MKAIVCTAYGPPDVLQLTDVEKPVPADDEVLIRIAATTVTAGDCEIRGFNVPLWLWLPMRLFMGISRPRKILGQELAGQVEAVGENVTRFAPGDRVFATTGFNLGAYAEYICLPAEPGEGGLAAIPAGMTFEQAAAVPVGGLEALHFIRLGGTRPGEKVLVNGAGGSIGTIAVQLAKSAGAEVTAVDSADKADMLRALGADHVVDYTREDFTASGQTYDVILDVVGKSPFSRSLRSLNSNGRYLLANPRLSQMIRGPLISAAGDKKVIFGSARHTSEDLAHLGGLVEAGDLRVVIDRRYPLEGMAEAHRYVETGRKKGNVIITVGQGDET